MNQWKNFEYFAIVMINIYLIYMSSQPIMGIVDGLDSFLLMSALFGIIGMIASYLISDQSSNQKETS